MSHYEDRREHFDGMLVMFRRGDSLKSDDRRIWQARIKIVGRKGYKTISLKTHKYEDAYAYAKEQFYRFQQMVKEGASLKDRTFANAWNEWYKTMVSDGAWTEDRKRWHRQYFNRYFNAYFGEKKLDEITVEFANGYWNWRRRYWVEGPGVNELRYNRRRKNLGNHSTANARTEVAAKTLLMEQSALNQIFWWCFSTKRFMRYSVRLKVNLSQMERKNEGRRPTFTNDEWRYLTANLGNWANQKGKYENDRLNSRHIYFRKQLRSFILFISATGIRPGTETRNMRWHDISTFTAEDGEQRLKIRISENSKKGISRTVISQPSAVKWIEEWREICISTEPQDLVWSGDQKEKGTYSTDMNKTFQSFLKTVAYKGRDGGLLNDADGNRRSLYSLRHFYASQRVLLGVSYEDLARNMGTGLNQLRKHYDWITSEQKAVEITKTRHSLKMKEIGNINEEKLKLIKLIKNASPGDIEVLLRIVKQ